MKSVFILLGLMIFIAFIIVAIILTYNPSIPRDQLSLAPESSPVSSPEFIR